MPGNGDCFKRPGVKCDFTTCTDSKCEGVDEGAPDDDYDDELEKKSAEAMKKTSKKIGTTIED